MSLLLFALCCGQAAPATGSADPAGAYPEGAYPAGKADLFGASLANVGDQDQDGVDDLAVGAPVDGSVRVFSARGELLSTIRGDARARFGNEIAAMDDRDGDGRAELLVRDGSGDRTLRIVDPLARSTAGATVFAGGLRGPFVCVGDANGDRAGDVAVLALGGSTVDLVVFSGVDGAQLSSLRLSDAPWSPRDRYAAGSLARAGDRDGDGVEDVYVGLDGLVPPRVELWSLGTQARLAVVRPDWKDQVRFGCTVAVLGDVDGDGAPDLAVVEPLETARWPAKSRLGSVTVLSSAHEALYRIRDLHARSASLARAHYEAFGETILAMGDVDGDGADDLAILSPAAFSGLSIHSGRNGALIRKFSDDDMTYEIGFGRAAARLGDVDGDGLADLALSGVSWGSPSVPGRVHVFSTKSGAELYELRLDGRVPATSRAPALGAPGEDH